MSLFKRSIFFCVLVLALAFQASASVSEVTTTAAPPPTDPCQNLMVATCSPSGQVADDGTGAAPLDKQILVDAVVHSVHLELTNQINQSASYREKIRELVEPHLSKFCQQNANVGSAGCRAELIARATPHLSLWALNSSKYYTTLTSPLPVAMSGNRQAPLYRQLAILRLSPETDKILNRVQVDIAHLSLAEQMTNEFRQIYLPRVKQLMIEKIESSVADPAARRRFIQKVESVTFERIGCPRHEFDLLSENAFYDEGLFGHGTIHFCPGEAYLELSEFSRVATLAHELAHSIGPCNEAQRDHRSNSEVSRKTLEAAYPFRGLIACLRDERSVGAEILPLATDTYASGNLPVLGKRRSVDVCLNDQINETFSDWLGTEVLAGYIEKYRPTLSREQVRAGYKNSARRFCSDPRPNSTHPGSFARIERILAVQPTIRRQMGCTGSPATGGVYCSLGQQLAPAAKSNSIRSVR